MESGRLTSSSPGEILEKAEQMLGKLGHKHGARGRSSEMRTAEEERYYLTVRVRWSYLLKKAGVRSADPRGGDTSPFRRA